jgi:hypothetical protein
VAVAVILMMDVRLSALTVCYVLIVTVAAIAERLRRSSQ